MKRKMLSILLCFALVIAAVLPMGTVLAQGTGPKVLQAADEDQNGLFLGKTAEEDGEDRYKISLEAYTNGEVKFEEKAVPLDIVLVLDQSGSMAEDIVVGSKDYYTSLWWNSNVTAASYGTVYYLDNGVYREVKVSVDYIWTEALYRYTYEYTDATGQVITLTSDRFWNDPPQPLDGNLYVKRTSDMKISRLEALQDAVGTFERQVIESTYGPDGIAGTEDDVNHKIAIVGFSGKGPRYSNTEVFVGDRTYTYGYSAKSQYKNALQDMTTAEGQDNIGKSLEKLEADGATYAQYGMEMANGILDTVTDTSRNKVVILFTDGYPGQNADRYDPDTANATIAQADIAKRSGALVYSVGIFNGADSSSAGNVNGNATEQSNYYMQKVSSNNGVPQEPSYYLSASDAGSLNEIFKTIGETISKPTIDLDSKTVIKDTVTPYFEMPADTSAINIYTADAIAPNGASWGEKQLADSSITAKIEENSVLVTGFDFNKYFVSKEPKPGTSDYGKKLIIEFTVTRKENFIGGNNVPTNGTDSGVYTEKGLVEAFGVPTVDMPIKYTYDTSDQTIFLGETADLANRINTPAYVDGINNAFVDIFYTIKNGDQIVGTYTIPKGELSGEWAWKAGQTGTPALTEDTTYTVDCIVKPTKAGTVPNYALNKNFTVTVESGTLTIQKKGGQDDEKYVFNIEKDGKYYMTVTVDGNGGTTIKKLPKGNYNVTEETAWSWRYGDQSYDQQTVTIDSSNLTQTVVCTNSKRNPKWLNGYNACVNAYAKGGAQ